MNYNQTRYLLTSKEVRYREPEILNGPGNDVFILKQVFQHY